jgi:hypothetical protein
MDDKPVQDRTPAEAGSRFWAPEPSPAERDPALVGRGQRRGAVSGLLRRRSRPVGRGNSVTDTGRRPEGRERRQRPAEPGSAAADGKPATKRRFWVPEPSLPVWRPTGQYWEYGPSAGAPRAAAAPPRSAAPPLGDASQRGGAVSGLLSRRSRPVGRGTVLRTRAAGRRAASGGSVARSPAPPGGSATRSGAQKQESPPLGGSVRRASQIAHRGLRGQVRTAAVRIAQWHEGTPFAPRL